MKQWWEGLARGAKWGFTVGVVLIVLATVSLGYWAVRAEPAVLFARMSPQDAAAMTKELEQMKVPYSLDEEGTSILVDRSIVHSTRLKLMGRDLPLQGAVGFELFNNSDFGMTEFAQKVNYQRALQGELTRTILSIAEVETARVHLAFPEDGLFKRENSRTKASITLRLRSGRPLQREQVRGIQRLVAAAVPAIEPDDVTLVDDRGVALTQDAAPGAGAPTSSARVDLKRDIEQYLVNKANGMLDKAFGPGEVMASVDVTLDMKMVKVTSEEATAPAVPAGEAAVGLVLKERETVREGGKSLAGSDSSAVTTQREVDYQLGRRVEQIVSAPGSITRLQAVAVTRRPLSPAQQEQLRQLLGGAVGASVERGDAVTVHSLADLPKVASVADSVPSNGRTELPPRAVEGGQAQVGTSTQGWFSMAWAGVGVVVALCAAAIAFLTARRRAGERERLAVTAVEGGGTLGREQALARVQSWLDRPAAAEGNAGR
jgi:flagellar M-ring protein FliF